MKRIFRILGIFILLIILSIAACIPIASKPRPEADTSDAAKIEALKEKMLAAVNADAWDTTRYVSWNFLGMHEHLWDREANTARIKWGSYKVYLDGGTLEGRVWKKEEEITDPEKKQKALSTATEHFFNDAYWLNAPTKITDEGVELGIVKLEDGNDALLATYTSGGITPGDAYLWELDEDGNPTHWSMWTKIFPIKGMRNTWEGWEDLYSGARIATIHGQGKFQVNMIRDLKAGSQLSDIGEEDNALDSWFFKTE
jgi:hypothetical protein